MDILRDLEFTDTAYGGYAVARSSSGQVIFVAGAVEGDIGDVELVESKKSFAYGKLINIKKPSPYRIKPVCSKANKCGGCPFAHIDYNYQVKIKEKIIKNSFRKFDNLPEINIHKTEDYGYRIRVSMVAEKGKVGFIAFKSNNFISVENCRILKSSLFNKIKDFAEKNNFTGEIKSIETPDGIFFADVKSNFNINDKSFFDGISINGNDSGLKYSSYKTYYGNVGVTCGSFFQSNRFLIDDFQKKVISLVPQSLSVVELYAGSGFFTCGLIENGNNVKAVEYDKKAANLGKIFNYPISQGDSGVFLSKIKNADVILLDPPRVGADKKVVNEILRLKPLYIVYVSCDPQTLSRDIQKLSDCYNITSIDFFDMFKDTYHIETAVLLSRK